MRQKILALGEFCISASRQFYNIHLQCYCSVGTYLIVAVVFVQLSTLHIEYIYEHLEFFTHAKRPSVGTLVCLDRPEYLVSLGSEVVLHECFLTATVPQMKHHIAEEPKSWLEIPKLKIFLLEPTSHAHAPLP